MSRLTAIVGGKHAKKWEYTEFVGRRIFTVNQSNNPKLAQVTVWDEEHNIPVTIFIDPDDVNIQKN